MKLYLSSEIERDLRKAISQDDVEWFSELASPLNWGKPSWSASQLLLQVLDDDVEKLWLWGINLSNHEDPHTRRYASRILLKLWEKDKNRAEQILTTLADDKHWLVWENAHYIWANFSRGIFNKPFQFFKLGVRIPRRTSEDVLRLRCEMPEI